MPLVQAQLKKVLICMAVRHSDSSTSPVKASKGRRWIKGLLWFVLAVVALVVIAVGAVLAWASSDGSLPRALQLAQKFLPQEQKLEFDNAQGSITGGGSIQQLQWSMPGVAVDVAQLSLDWSLAQLLSRKLDVHELTAARVHVRLTPTPDQAAAEPASAPFVMPERITLPLQLSVPLRVGELAIESINEEGVSQTQTIEDIAAQYRYDGVQHALQLDSLQYGQSHLQAQLSLGAHDLAVQGVLGAWLADLVPEVPLTMHAVLQAKGSLAGGAAAGLQVDLDAQEQPAGRVWQAGRHLLVPLPQAAAALADAPEQTQQAGAASAATARSLAAVQLQAQLHPWREQPVQTALLMLQRLNAQAFHAAAPQTDLSGNVRIEPDASSGTASSDLASAQWQLDAQIRNALPGAWDQALLPLQSFKAQMHYAPELLKIEQAELVLEGAGPAGQLQVQGAVNPRHPADAQVTLELSALNLQPLMQGLPHTALSGQLLAKPLQGSDPLAVSDLAQAQWAIDADIRNTEPGLIDQQRLPLTQLLAKARIETDRWLIDTVQAHVDQGQVQLEGFFEPKTQQLDVRGQVIKLPLVMMHSELAAEQVPSLNGQLALAGQLDSELRFDVNIRNAQGTSTASARPQGSAGNSRWNVSALELKGQYSPSLLAIERVYVDAFAAKLDGHSIRVALPEAEAIEAVLQASAPGLSLNADAKMQHTTGGGKLALQVSSAPELIQWLSGLPVIGSQLPPMRATGQAQLAVDWQGGWQQWLAELQQPVASSKVAFNAQASSEGLVFEMLPAAKAPAKAPASAAKPLKNAAAAKTAGKSNAPETAETEIDIKSLQLLLNGNPAAANLTLNTDVLVNGLQAVLQAQAQLKKANSGNAAGPVWNVLLDKLHVAATLPEFTQPWTLELSEPLSSSVQLGNSLRVKAGAGQLSLTPPKAISADGAAMRLMWEPVDFSQSANGALNLQTKGQMHGLVVAWLDSLLSQNPPLKAAGVQTDLLLSGAWNVRMAGTMEIQASLQRDSGDIWLGDPVVEQISTGPGEHEEIVQSYKSGPGKGMAVGVKALALRAQSSGDALELSFDWDTQRAGVIQANAQTRLTKEAGGWTLKSNAPLSGRVQAKMDDLGIWTGLAPLGWRISGELDADIRVAGQLNAPVLEGPIQANGLNLSSVLDGVELHDGRLRAELAGTRLRINELVFQGGTNSHAYVKGMSGNRTQAPTARGLMTASGYVDWGQVPSASQSGIAMDFKAKLDAMQVLARTDRQVSLSGSLDASLQDGQMRVRGDINVDRASITLPSSSAPTLGSDVVVVRGNQPINQNPMVEGELQTAKPMDLNLKLNLGRDFALEGYGITTRLEGELEIRNSTRGNDPVSIVGEVRTDRGRYRAWGQALDVETGIVLFNGPYANPSINLLAVRPNTPIDITAGVRVTGTAQSPRVQLYSNPTMPDSETLSWVLLGRAPNAGSGDSNAMQQAALGLLANSVGSSLADGFGFDSVGLGQNGLEIGKRLSDQLYVTYQSGLAGAASTFYVFYDITQRLTLRGQTGTDSAVDLVYTITYDGKKF